MSIWNTPERTALRELVRDFTAKEIVPHLAGWEDAGELPRDLHARAAGAGVQVARQLPGVLPAGQVRDDLLGGE
ncbi:acyl-CoA dehydrogenase family protein, partial [Actinomadura sp. WAC 06369]|uniref:acyl-CoA dehydrogenase family protein n=1 Tax=Actinomadura sp. WAC 06369 TaxID=2203193 RepID=UPI0010012FDF